MNINDLQQLLQFYDKNLRGAEPKPFYAGGAWNSPGGENRPGLLWAQEFLRQSNAQQRPDFFGGQPMPQAPAYVQPRQIDMNAPRPQVQMRSDYFANDSLRPQVNNFLAQLLGSQPRAGSGAY